MLSSVNRPPRPPKKTPYPPKSNRPPVDPLDPLDPPLKNFFEILGGLFDPPPEKKSRDIYGNKNGKICTPGLGRI